MPVKNIIAELRVAAGLTQRALGASLGTSRQQMARHEAGDEISPGMALAIARTLGQPLKAVFPQVGSRAPQSQLEWRRLGFDLEAPLPTWHLNIQLRSIAEPFIYLVDCRDCERLKDILNDPESACDFIAFDSCGRSIYVSTKAIQRVFVVEDGVTLQPGVRHNIGALRPEYASLRLFLADRAEPLCVDAFDREEDELEAVFEPLDYGSDFDNRFLAFRDDEGDLVYVRAGEIALVELPNSELLEEMEDLDEGFWESAYRKLEFEGRPMPDADADVLLPAVAQASAIALKKHAIGRIWAPADGGASSRILQLAFADAVEVLRQHGYSIIPGEAKKAWIIEQEGYWAPLYEALFEAFAKALHRARQHGEEVGSFTGDMIKVALFSGLAALRDEGHRIAPGDLFIDYEPGRGGGEPSHE